MKRYHHKIFYPEGSKTNLEVFTYNLNSLCWKYSQHSIEGLQYRGINIETILLYINDCKLQAATIFEFYTDKDKNIIKACYRIPYNEYTDIIIVIGNDKKIVTIYTNGKDDLHYTLNEGYYDRD